MSELFELVEEALDTVALLINLGVIGALNLAVALWRNNGLHSSFRNSVAQVVGIIAFVGQQGIGINVVDKIMSEGNIIVLAGTCDQADRKTECFGGGVYFGAPTSARPTQALGIRPPLTLRAPAAC